MKSRGEKAIINTATSLLMELVAIICGLILPRLILSRFGSAYNGLTTSISQFLNCAVLLRSGIGGATRAALYKPMQMGDTDKINAIMSATDRFMKKIAAILTLMILGFSVIYPVFVRNEFGWLFTFSLYLIMGIDTFFQSLFGITNYILLQADQRTYISAIAHIVSYILNTVIAVILIRMGFGIHIIKLGSAFAFTMYPVILKLYVKRHYKIDFSVEPDNSSINQRWDAFFHQVAGFVMTNTDTMVLTVFTVMSEVSVYSVYNMVIIAVRKLTKSFTDGLEAAFGSIMAEGKQKVLESNFRLVEMIIFNVSTFVNICVGNLLVDFVMIYTKNIEDVDYRRPLFALILAIAQFFNAVRQPYQMVVQAAGHYKQTKRGAIAEPIINITISVIMVIKFGMIGVAIGTLAAIVFRTLQYAIYVGKNFINGAFRRMMLLVLLSAVQYVIVSMAYRRLPLSEAVTYGAWVVHGFVIALIAFAVIMVSMVLFERKEIASLKKQMKRILKPFRKNIK